MLFAAYRDRVGAPEMRIDLPDGATVGRAAQEMAARFPALTGNPDGLVVAVNEEYADHYRTLEDGDELALIPPVSGGR